MRPDHQIYRRVLQLYYRRYLRAERALRMAQNEAASWLPARQHRMVLLIGNPGSRMRALYERRNRAMRQLSLIQQELDELKKPVPLSRARIMLIDYSA
ncbi:MAG TPA: hypothetical protein VLA51_06330 [Paracoccaceae bacterium]|nr:hypothetical protein [Paracoccaceae bacterium]